MIERDLDSTGSGSYSYIEYFVYDGESLAFVFVDPDGAGPQPIALSERVVDGPGIAGAHDAVFAEVCNCEGDTNDNSLPLDLSSDLGQTLDEVIGNGPTMDPQTMIQRPVGDGAGGGGAGGGGPGAGIDGFAGGGGGTDGGTPDTNDAGCNCGSSVPVFANGAASFQILAYETVTSLSSPGSVTWALLDNQNTVRDIIDVNGNVVDHMVYNSFGLLVHETSPGVFHVLGYAGGIYDPDAGLINFWHRWYDPVVGRWISEDPAGFGAGDPNLVRYVGNSTTLYTDSSGLEVKLECHQVQKPKRDKHLAITIIPFDQKKWATHPRFSNKLEDGRHYLVISAGPERLPPSPGRLIKGDNRPTDTPPTKNHPVRPNIKIPDGMTEDEFISKLIELHDGYANNQDYDLWPKQGTSGYNSNSYVSGLIKEAGGIVFPGLTEREYPGWNKPCPATFYYENPH